MINNSNFNPNSFYSPQMNNMMQWFQNLAKFRNSFTGNAQQTIQELMRSGRITQQQYDQAVQLAQQFQQFIPN